MPTKRENNSSRSAVKTSERPLSAARIATSPLRVVSTGSNSYELPVIHMRISEGAVNAAFWGGLVGAVILGAADPPLAALIGLGVVIARHRQRS